MSYYVNRQTVVLADQRSDLATLNVSMAKAQNAPYMAGSHTPQFYTLTCDLAVK